MGAQMHLPQASGAIEMRERPFQTFAALPQESAAARAPNAAPVAIDGIARLGVGMIYLKLRPGWRTRKSQVGRGV